MKSQLVAYKMLPIDYGKLRAMQKGTGFSLSKLIRAYVRFGFDACKELKMSELVSKIQLSDSETLSENLKIKNGEYQIDFPFPVSSLENKED